MKLKCVVETITDTSPTWLALCEHFPVSWLVHKGPYASVDKELCESNRFIDRIQNITMEQLNEYNKSI